MSTDPEWAALSKVLKTNGALVRRAREARGWTQAHIADLVGTTQQTVDRIERGAIKHSRWIFPLMEALKLPDETGIIPEAANIIAPGIGGTGGEEILDDFRPNYERGPDEPGEWDDYPNLKELIPIYPLGKRDGSYIILRHRFDAAGRPEQLDGVAGAYAFYVVGDEMHPALRQGDVAYAHPQRPPRPMDDLILFGPRASPQTIALGTLKGQTPTEWQLEQYNPPKTFTLLKAEWPRAHVIVGKFTHT